MLFYKPILRSICCHAYISFFLHGQCVSQTVCGIYIALASASLLWVGQQVGYSSRKFYLPSDASGLFPLDFFYKVCSPTPWIFAFSGFSAMSDLDTLKVGALFAHLVSCGSPTLVSPLEGLLLISLSNFLVGLSRGLTTAITGKEFPCIQSILCSTLFCVCGLPHACIFNRRVTVSVTLHCHKGLSHSLGAGFSGASSVVHSEFHRSLTFCRIPYCGALAVASFPCCTGVLSKTNPLPGLPMEVNHSQFSFLSSIL